MFLEKAVKAIEPLLIFVFALVYWKYDIFWATAALGGAQTLFVVLSKLLKLPLSKMQITTWLIIVSLTALTLLFRDEIFIKWKTTVVNTIFATVFLGSHFIGKKTILERFVSEHLPGADSKLRTVNAACVGNFLFVAILNVFVAYSFSTDVWVTFKVGGIFVLHILFMSWCFYYLRHPISKYLETMQESEKNKS